MEGDAMFFEGQAPSSLVAVWNVLAHDLRVPVAVVRLDGVVEFANTCYARAVEGKGPMDPIDPVSMVGRNLRDLLPDNVRAERLALLNLAATSSRPLLIVEMMAGRWMRTIMRAMPSPDGQPCTSVLIVQRFECSSSSGRLPGDSERYHVIFAAHNDQGVLAELSPRELQVLTYIGEGLSMVTIGALLGLMPKTVEWHRGSLGKKLMVKTKLELAQIAMGAGLSSDGPPVKGPTQRREFGIKVQERGLHNAHAKRTHNTSVDGRRDADAAKSITSPDVETI